MPKTNSSTLGVGLSQPSSQKQKQNWLLSWLFQLVEKFRLTLNTSWEIYPILFIAGFLRLFQNNTTEFDGDQATIFSMAHDAISHFLLPATSNIASIGIVNPPAIVYLLMLPAALSPNPLWAIVMVGLFNTAAVLLTYLFTRRYFGRPAAIIATLLYAAAAKVIEYSRFLWQQNMIAPFVLLFLFALYWGVVERRKGWLFPALLLLGILFQLHEITTLLIAPFLVALILAPGTIRWRDLALGLISLFVIFSTYLLWEVATKFYDVQTALKVSKTPAHIDNQAILFYQFFLSPFGLNPFDSPPRSPHSVLRPLAPILSWLQTILPLLVVAGLVTVLILLLWPRLASARHEKTFNSEDSEEEQEEPLWRPETKVDVREHDQMGETERVARTDRLYAPLRFIWSHWSRLLASPYKCGLIVLLIWQIVPIAVLSSHSVSLYPYYFLMLMPGPFILIGLFIAKIFAWFYGLTQQSSSHANPRNQFPSPRHAIGGIVSSGIFMLTAMLIILQLVGSVAALIDDVQGNLGHGSTYNDLHSLQYALSQADQLAQRDHLNRVYIATDPYTQDSLNYLAEQMRTPTTLFDSTRCLILPNPADGPAVLLTGPADGLTNALLSRFANATLVGQPPRLGSTPFQLYIVKPLAGVAQSGTLNGFVQNLQLLDMHVQPFRFNHASWLVTRWRLLKNAHPSFRTSYNYILKASDNRGQVQEHLASSICTFTTMRAGDQLLVVFPSSATAISLPTSLIVTAQSFTVTPHNPVFGPFHLETIKNDQTSLLLLQTAEYTLSITLPVIQKDVIG